MNKNRIQGVAEQGERAKTREALVAKAKRRRSGGCAVKQCALTRSDETGLPRQGTEGAGRDLLTQVLARENMERAWKRVKANKGAVASVFGRRFLGYALWRTSEGEVRRGVSEKALQAFKQRVRQLTRRGGGRSIEQVVEKLRSYLLGWKGYYGLAQIPRVWRRLDEWIRRRLRTLHLKQWRRGKTAYRELLRLGASPTVAHSVAALSRRWWHNSRSALHSVLTIAYFDRLGVPRLS